MQKLLEKLDLQSYESTQNFLYRKLGLLLYEDSEKSEFTNWASYRL
ncbi:hypothetical protein ES319_A11G351700v1 [Gossypium barbadense]|uniref:Uncharacterized protein n=2 Tax=Gossypium TaxID=3633 RepID=A0A5J5TWS7_GOSBA|nr:hypothetical protein ES319_A11G351700v1 [Gossypium barbadense]TYG96840.1 hypothetical protein ES288_A11G385400v1 [Gossypium darwinii]